VREEKKKKGASLAGCGGIQYRRKTHKLQMEKE